MGTPLDNWFDLISKVLIQKHSVAHGNEWCSCLSLFRGVGFARLFEFLKPLAHCELLSLQQVGSPSPLSLINAQSSGLFFDTRVILDPWKNCIVNFRIISLLIRLMIEKNYFSSTKHRKLKNKDIMYNGQVQKPTDYLPKPWTIFVPVLLGFHVLTSVYINNVPFCIVSFYFS